MGNRHKVTHGKGKKRIIAQMQKGNFLPPRPYRPEDGDYIATFIDAWVKGKPTFKKVVIHRDKVKVKGKYIPAGPNANTRDSILIKQQLKELEDARHNTNNQN